VLIIETQEAIFNVNDFIRPEKCHPTWFYFLNKYCISRRARKNNGVKYGATTDTHEWRKITARKEAL